MIFILTLIIFRPFLDSCFLGWAILRLMAPNLDFNQKTSGLTKIAPSNNRVEKKKLENVNVLTHNAIALYLFMYTEKSFLG